MKNITKLTCLALGAALITTAAPIAFSGTTSGGCCGAMTPMADTAKSDTKAKAYPLDTCIVSGEKLGEMGDPFVFTHEGQEIKLCCKSCKKKFDKSPETYLKKLKDAPAKK
jgi:YHS domain-containing protein